MSLERQTKTQIAKMAEKGCTNLPAVTYRTYYQLLESQQQQRREFDDGTNGTDLTACTVPKKRTRQDKDNPPAKKTAGREKDNRKMPVKSKPLASQMKNNKNKQK